MTERVIHLKGFFEEARAGRLTGIRCGRCGALALPPKEFCEQCGERDWQPVPLDGAGSLGADPPLPRFHQRQLRLAAAHRIGQPLLRHARALPHLLQQPAKPRGRT